MTLRVRVNGQEQDSIPVDDRGLAYGDGLFETIAVYRGRPLLFNSHIDRLLTGCKALAIANPPSPDQLQQEVNTVCNDIERGIVKLILTRGSNQRGYDPSGATTPRTIIAAYPWPDCAALRRDGMAVGMCKITLAPQPQLAGIKHLNRLEQVLARSEWQADWQEALLQDQHGSIVSGTQSNFFLVRDGNLVTPPIIDCGVAGIMRDTILKFAQELGIECQKKTISAVELTYTQQAFMTNSVLGIAPVREICNTVAKIGPITRQLQDYLYENQFVVPD